MRYERERDQLVRFADNRLRKEGPDAVNGATARSTTPRASTGSSGLDPLV